MANDLTIYENQLSRALASAEMAQGNIDRERARQGKPLAQKKMFTASEMRSEVMAAVAHAETAAMQSNLAIIKAMKATYGKTDPDDPFPGWTRKFFSDRDSPSGQAFVAMMKTLAKGAAVERRERGAETDPMDDPTGGGDNIVELPTDALARSIIRAGAKRRGEDV